MPYSYIDLVHRLPLLPWPKVMSMVRRADQYHEQYKDIRTQLLSESWGFFDWCASAEMSRHDLAEHSKATGDPDEASGWFLDYGDPEFLFGNGAPAAFIPLQNLWLASYPDLDQSEWDRDRWPLITFQAAIDGHEQLYWLGLVSRFVTQMAQLRAALVIRNILCLDFRGRPVLV